VCGIVGFLDQTAALTSKRSSGEWRTALSSGPGRFGRLDGSRGRHCSRPPPPFDSWTVARRAQPMISRAVGTSSHTTARYTTGASCAKRWKVIPKAFQGFGGTRTRKCSCMRSSAGALRGRCDVRSACSPSLSGSRVTDALLGSGSDGREAALLRVERGVFLFGSELKALRAHPTWHGDIDRQSLDMLLRYGFIPAPWSIFSGIFKVHPEHRLLQAQ